MILKFRMKQWAMELCKIYLNHDSGMTLTYFTARSTEIANAFEWGKRILRQGQLRSPIPLNGENC